MSLPLENQLCSLELAKKLKELGIEQDSYFWWYQRQRYFVGVGEINASKPELTNEKPPYDFPYVAIASAFTVAELGEMLPKEVHFFTGIKVKKRRTHPQHLHIFHSSYAGWMVNYTGGGARENYTQSAPTEADARAKMLVYLLENKLIPKP